MSETRKTGLKLNAARTEIKARREGREVLIRAVLHDRSAEQTVNVDELTTAIAQALREALR